MNLIDHVVNEHSLMFPDLLLLAMASSIMLEQTVMFSDIPSYTHNTGQVVSRDGSESRHPLLRHFRPVGSALGMT